MSKKVAHCIVGALSVLSILSIGWIAYVLFEPSIDKVVIEHLSYVLVVGTIVISLIVRHFVKRHLNTRRVKRMHRGERIGLYLSPTHTNFFLRPLLSLIAGEAIGWAFYLFDQLLKSNVFPVWGAVSIGLLFAILFVLNDPKVIEVPKNYAAIYTFLGIRFNIYLTEGDHYWYGQKFGFGYSTEALPNRKEDGDYKYEAKGFVFLGNRPLGIWRSREDKGKMKLSNVAHDGSTIFNTLTVTVRTVWPLRWANSDDPILDVAERSRSAFRTLVSFFVGIDNAMLKSIASQLMGGHAIVTAFTSKLVGINPAGSVIQNHNGDRIFTVIDRGGDIEGARKEIAGRIENEADKDMAETVKRDDKPFIQHKQVVDDLIPVMDENGAYFVHASVSGVELSEEVAKQANEASGENYQRVGQLQSARTVKAARDILAEDLDKPGAKDAAYMALVRDGHADMVIVPDGSNIVKAAIAGGKQIGGKK